MHMGSLQMEKTVSSNSEEDFDATEFLKRNGYKLARELDKTETRFLHLYILNSAAHRANPSPFGVTEVVVKGSRRGYTVNPLHPLVTEEGCGKGQVP